MQCDGVKQAGSLTTSLHSVPTSSDTDVFIYIHITPRLLFALHNYIDFPLQEYTTKPEIYILGNYIHVDDTESPWTVNCLYYPKCFLGP